MGDCLYIIMPAYNEEANIEQVIEAWYPIIERHNENGKSRLVIIDDGSKDRTYEIMKECTKGRAYFEPVTKKNAGHGPTVLYGYRYAIENGADYVFQTDSDGQTTPEEFEMFWEMRTKCDAIFGNRTVRGDGKDRAFVEKVVCILLKIYFGVKVPDANAPYRLFKCETLAKYLDKLPLDYNLPNIMLTTYYAYYDEKMQFKEISFKPRVAGTNSINIPRIVKIGWKALGDFAKLKREMKK